ncbi:three-Cys-motif partner protein [Dyadobacter soli]|uniref:Three-Cys-motif partner protein n=1 Tax=Dyadobacter soli TaxID=659014 RepID=A0A1G7JI71_9BACT|nr:three-Cys-motif partner protein TcmP [Dyadobacter soli]SDF24596.1 three-Cys-motif partner protein [Dyadobacter soli]
MPAKDLHEEPFDDGTITKLEIFEDYAQAWIPTFVMKAEPIICIFDFFAGTGYDKNGIAGSPIRILDKIKDHIGYIFQKRVKIRVYVNEYEPNKVSQRKHELLVKACNEYLETNQDVKRAIEILTYNEDFETLFPKLLPEIKLYPSLVYIDQNGVRFLSDKYLLQFEKMTQTDFLYFASSSYLRRLGHTEQFKKHLQLDIELLKEVPYNLVHRNLISQLTLRFSNNTKLRLYPFSIKKGTNIYGIIFGASHPRAVEKFLSIAWKKNDVNGQSNFDMDQDIPSAQLDLFGIQKLTKIQKFKSTLRDMVLTGQITSNFEALDFVYAEGHIGKHAADVLKEMKQKGEVSYIANSPCINYEKVYKEKQLIKFNLPKK